VQILGGYGYCREYPQEQFMRDARIAAIYEGSNGIQALDLFTRKVPMKGGELFKSYMGEIGGFMEANLGLRPSIDDILSSTADAAKILSRTTATLGEVVREDLGVGLVQATPYLRMFGHVACAFELAKQAVLAHDKLQAVYEEKGASTDDERARLYETNADVNYYRGKLHAARFFANAILPEVHGYQESLTSRDSSAVDIRFGLEEES